MHSDLEKKKPCLVYSINKNRTASQIRLEHGKRNNNGTVCWKFLRSLTRQHSDAHCE